MKALADSLTGAGFTASYQHNGLSGILRVNGAHFYCYKLSRHNGSFRFHGVEFVPGSKVQRGVTLVLQELPKLLGKVKQQTERERLDEQERLLLALSDAVKVQAFKDDYRVSFSVKDYVDAEKLVRILDALLSGEKVETPWFDSVDARVVNLFLDTCSYDDRQRYYEWRRQHPTDPPSKSIWTDPKEKCEIFLDSSEDV